LAGNLPLMKKKRGPAALHRKKRRTTHSRKGEKGEIYWGERHVRSTKKTDFRDTSVSTLEGIFDKKKGGRGRERNLVN